MRLAVAVLLGVNSLSPSAWAALAELDRPLLDLSQFDVEQVSVPSDWGHVTEAWQPEGHSPKGLIFHLQDLHTHPQAQQHLSEIIGYLHERYGLDLVALEGAEGLCDTTLYSDFPDPPSTEKISRLFMQEGLFTGAEYYGITHPGAVTLWGVEDEDLYLQHLDIHRRNTASAVSVRATLAHLNMLLDVTCSS